MLPLEQLRLEPGPAFNPPASSCLTFRVEYAHVTVIYHRAIAHN